MMTFRKPRARAASQPGRTRRCRREWADSQVTFGSIMTTSMPRFMRSTTQWP